MVAVAAKVAAKMTAGTECFKYLKKTMTSTSDWGHSSSKRPNMGAQKNGFCLNFFSK
jgi:hypothetical protein